VQVLITTTSAGSVKSTSRNPPVSTDRSKTPHHFIDLLKDAAVKADGNALTYNLQAVSSELPGTYTASLWAVKKGDPPVNQAFTLVDFQLGTATAENQIVQQAKCAACHLGAQNGQFYFAHVDPGRTPYGSPSIDTMPVRTCKSCHNNDGYAAYAGDILTPPGPATARTPDPIVRRVHGVHMGEELENSFNTDPATGNFKDYTGVIFPANVKNCTTCHTDDRWKTAPSREACGACHDNVWFGEKASMPAGEVAHPGGPQANDAACAACHTPDSGGAAPISAAHKVSQLINTADVSLTPPSNGKFYTAADKPKVTIVIKDDNGNPLADHTRVDNVNFSTAGLFVYGPREHSVPALTNAAKNANSRYRASLTNAVVASGTPTKGWTFNAGDTLKIAVNGNAPQELAAPAGLQTPDQVRDWLKANLTDVTVTSSAAGTVTVRSNLQGDKSRIEIYNSPVTTTMGWKRAGVPMASGGLTAGVTVEPYVVIGQGSYPINDLRKLSDPLDYSDPNVTRSVGNITYQLDGAAGLTPGTYMIYVWVQPAAGKIAGLTRSTIGFLNFQVGTETVEKPVATNCTQCHGNTIWHLDEGPQHPEPFNPDYCKACHDYSRYATGEGFDRLGGTSTSGWSGYGAVPLARRVHGVHFGAYLDHPEEIYAGNPNIFNEVIFPQDVRNCTKCHDDNPMWKEEPSRLACNACHDSAKARAHTTMATIDPTPKDPFGGDETETCTVCHGAGRDFSPDKVHNISNPYQPPYPREKER